MVQESPKDGNPSCLADVITETFGFVCTYLCIHSVLKWCQMVPDGFWKSIQLKLWDKFVPHIGILMGFITMNDVAGLFCDQGAISIHDNQQRNTCGEYQHADGRGTQILRRCTVQKKEGGGACLQQVTPREKIV